MGWADRAELGLSVLAVGISYKVSIDEWGLQLKNKNKMCHCNILHTCTLNLRAYH